VYSTFIGGYYYDDVSSSIAIDNMGSVYITGYTSSFDYPTTQGAFSETGYAEWVCDEEYCYPGKTAFVTKLNSSGSALQYSTFIGGLTYQVGTSVAVDGNYNAFVTGSTSSADFPTTPGSFDETYNGGYDVFAVKLNNTGSALLYSSFAGGEYDDYSAGIATDANGNAYLTGHTRSGNFPVTPGAFDQTFNSGYYDAFVMKLNPTGSSLVYSTYVGSNSDDFSYELAVDASGAVYITGLTWGLNYPVTAGAYDETFNGRGDVFITKLNSGGSALIYSTYIGGSFEEGSSSIALDSDGNAYVTGYMYVYPGNYSNYPVTPDAFDLTFNGAIYDAFVSILNSNGTSLLYSTFLGGSVYDHGNAIATDVNGYVFVTGNTFSPEFPITNGAFDQTYNGMWDVFVTKLEVTLNNTFAFAPSNNSPFCAGNTLYLTVFPAGGPAPYTYSWTGPNGFSSTLQNPTIVNATAAASGTYSVTVSDAAGHTGTANTVVVINPLPVASIVAATPVCGACITLTASGGVSYSWSTGSTTNIALACTDGTYYVTVTSADGCKDQETIRATPIYPSVAYISTSPGCSGCTTLTASMGSAFLWSTGSTDYSITACTIGTYSVVVTDYRGCQSTATTTVGTPGALCAIPLNPSAWNITTNSAWLNWWTNHCAIGYQVRYRVAGTSTWTTKNISTNTYFLDVKGLKRGTNYEWQVRSKCTAVPTEMYSAFTSSQFFSTLSNTGPTNTTRTTIADEEMKIAIPARLTVWPNPSSARIMINVSGLKGLSELRVVSMLGQVVISQTIVLKEGQAQAINIAGLSQGVYKLVLRNRESLLTGTFIKK